MGDTEGISGTGERLDRFVRSGFTADEPFGFTRDDVVALRVSGVWGFREWLDEEELAVGPN